VAYACPPARLGAEFSAGLAAASLIDAEHRGGRRVALQQHTH
jgi:hypothetical protein